MIEYGENFIKSYKDKYEQWYKIPFDSQKTFYHHYIEICEDIGHQDFAKEISKDILYKNISIPLSVVKRVGNLLHLDLRKERATVLAINENYEVKNWCQFAINVGLSLLSQTTNQNIRFVATNLDV